MKGLITIEKTRDRHRQLPRRVRDEPVEGGPRGRHPVARDRPAGLPPGGPLELGRADRRDPAVLPREPRHPAGRGAQVHRARASSSRSSPGCRSPTAQDRLRELLEAKWDAGTADAAGVPTADALRAAASTRRDRPHRRRRGRRRRDEDGLGRRHRPGARRSTRAASSPRSRASAATSTSSSTRAS